MSHHPQPALSDAQVAYRVPYRNLRHLLSLQAKVAPTKPFLIAYDAAGEREVLPYVEVNSRAHQTAHFLYDDLGLRRGDRLLVLGENVSDTVIIYLACWVLGVSVVPWNPAEGSLPDAAAEVCLAPGHTLEALESTPNLRHIVQVGGQPRAGYPQFHALVRTLPNTFFSDDPEPTLAHEALLIYGENGQALPLSQYTMLASARGSADAQAISGNHCLMGVQPLHQVNGMVTGLLTALWTGGTLVLNAAFSPGDLWRRMTAERAHIVSLDRAHLEACLHFAQSQQARGQPIWGDGVHQQDMTHVRHILCAGADTALLRAFEECFGLPVLHGLRLNQMAGYAAFMPIDLDWKAHQGWLLASDDVCIGCALEGIEMAVLAPDERALRAGESGEICLRRPGQSQPTTPPDGWLHSGAHGYYRPDPRGRHFFYLNA